MPSETDSTLVIWLKNSLDSTMKSFPEFSWAILYGKVFLTKFELLKSKDWSKSSTTGFDLNVLPIKYGNTGSSFPLGDAVATPT